jgi:hypothetical protein
MYANAANALLAVRAPAHLGFIYDPRGSWREVVLAFLAQGLAQGERVTYLYDHGEAQDHLNDLDRMGVAVGEALAGGQFSLMEAGRFYRAQHQNPDLGDNLGLGMMPPTALLEQVTSTLKKDQKLGFPRLRTVAEMGWADSDNPKELELLAEYEQRLNSDIFPHFPLTSLCLYDRQRFNPLWQDMVCRSHPLLFSPAGLIQQETTPAG